MNPLQTALWYFRLKPFIERFQGLLKMKLSTNVFSQMLALAIQAANQFAGVVPVKYQAFVTLGIGLAQTIVAFLAHYSPAPNAPEVK